MAQSKKTNKKKEKRNGFSFFSDMDPDKKSLAIKGLGVLVGVFALFTLVATVSYLFTWQTDQSLMSQPDMLDKEIDVAEPWNPFGVCTLPPSAQPYSLYI